MENRFTVSANAANACRRMLLSKLADQPPFVALGSSSAMSRFHAVYGASFWRNSLFTSEMNESRFVEVNSRCRNSA